MKLYKIIIQNFRSIKSEVIYLRQNCLVLLGKNEAGKSNILKAIASVFNQYQVTNKDKRKRIDNEPITECFVRACIKLEDRDFEKISKNIRSKYTGVDTIKFKNDKTLNEYIRAVFYEVILTIKIVI